MTEPARRFTFVDAVGRRAAFDPPLRVLDALAAGQSDRAKAALRLGDGTRAYFMKTRRYRTIKRRLLATLNRSPLDNEARMAAAAAKAGLPVLPVRWRGARRCCGLIVEQALIYDWLEGHRSLQDAALDAARRDDQASLDAMQAVLVDTVVQVRRAALADEDLGAHNLLAPLAAGAAFTASQSGAARTTVWVDLEAAEHADPHDAPATCRTVGAALANWWVATAGDRRRLETAFEAMRDRLPKPRGGWAALATPLNAVIARRAGKAARHGLVDRPPPPLVCR